MPGRRDDRPPKSKKTSGPKSSGPKSAKPFAARSSPAGKKFGTKPSEPKSFKPKPFGAKPFGAKPDGDRAERGERPRTGSAPKAAFWEKAPSKYKKPSKPARLGASNRDSEPRKFGNKPFGTNIFQSESEVSPKRYSKDRAPRPPRVADGPPHGPKSYGKPSGRGYPPRRDDDSPRPPRRNFDGPPGPRDAGDGTKPFRAKTTGDKRFDSAPFRSKSKKVPKSRYGEDRPTRPPAWRDGPPPADRPYSQPAGRGFPKRRDDDSPRPPRPPRGFDGPPPRAPRRDVGERSQRNRPENSERPPRRPIDAGRPPAARRTPSPRPESARPLRDTEPPRPQQSRAPLRHDSAANISPARRVAFEVLRQVEQGAHSTDLLRERTGYLDPRDRGLATEIVLGVLRRRPQLDFLIRHFSERDPALTTEVRIALQMGIYQLRYLERIPTFAAVDETVEIVRALGQIPASGFVNAVLRRVTREEVRWPDRATTLCLPTWMLRRWDAQFGKQATTALGEVCLQVPETFIRVPVGVEPPPGVESTQVRGCYRVPEGVDPSGFRFQDIGSQSIVPLLDLQPGHWHLDIASAPGGKFLQACETPGLHAIAADSSLKRLREVEAESRVVIDGTRPLPFGRKFDRILLDAPCSGTGTIRRNPEIRWRAQPGDLVRHHERQVKLLAEAIKALTPGGRLVYSTCSLEPEENEEVVQRIQADFGSSIRLIDTTRRTPGTDAGDGFYAAVLTLVP